MAPITRRGRRPLSPPAAALTAAATGGGLSRRALLGSGVAAGAGLALTGCAPPEPPAASGGLASLDLPTDVSDEEKILKWANWTAYLDMNGKETRSPTLEAFMEQTGIEVSYTEDIDDNDSYYAKVAPQLRAGQSIDRDIFTLTDWMAGRVIRDQLCQPLQLIQMPNVVGNLLQPLKDVSFDPGRNYSITWQSGFAGIGYNRDKVGRELKSLDDLWTDDLKGRVVVLSEFRDTAGLVMQSQGVDIDSDWGRAEFENALDFIEQKIEEGYIRKVKGNSYMEDLTSGNAVAGITWSGDIFVLAYDTEDPAWTFTIPESGGTLWSDNLMVPITSTHRSNAQRLMDYYYDPAVAAQVAAWVNYVCPVEGAQAEMEKIDPELAASPWIFPTADFISESNIQQFRALDADEDIEFADLWSTKVMGN
jgi:spermidine/putrescine transport system substrate-binding protein